MANKKKGFKRFFKGLLIYSIVFALLAAAGLYVLWDFIDAYELSRPKTAIAPYVEQLTKEQIAAGDEAVLSQIDHNIQTEEACKQFIADSLQSNITYAQNVAESTDTQTVYMLMCGGKVIGKVTLGAMPADNYGFTPWKVTGASFDFSYLVGQGASITVPQDFTVYANGVPLDSSYITEENIQYAELKDYYKDYQPPYMVTYTVEAILGDIQLTTQDRNGNEVTLDENTDYSQYINNCTASQLSAIDQLLDPFLRSYVTYTSGSGGNWNTRNNYNKLAKYLVPGGDMQKRMYSAMDGLYWARDTQSTLQEITVNHAVDLGNGYILCDVTYKVAARVYKDDPITINNAEMILVQTESGLLVESLMSY